VRPEETEQPCAKAG